MTRLPPKAGLALKLTGIFAGSVALGGLLAPLIFNMLIWFGRHAPGCEGLREILFEKVANRVVMLFVFGGALAMMRCAGLRTLARQGFPRGAPWKRELAGGFGLGVLTMSALLLAAWLSGAYIPGSDGWGLAFWGKMAGNLLGAWLIGYLEEWLFRGVIFGSLRQAFGVIAAAVSASAFFALVHFARTENPVGIVHGSWYSAFSLMPYMFTADDLNWGYEGFKLPILFFMGLSLCFFYARSNRLYFCIGLHAGWVWIMRLGDYAFEDRAKEVMPYLFGPTPGIAKSGIALALSVAFCLYAMLSWARSLRHEGGAA